MSARDDYPFIAGWARTAYEQNDRRQCAAALDRIDRLEAQLVRVRAEYAAALTRITDAQLTVDECDRLLAAIQQQDRVDRAVLSVRDEPCTSIGTATPAAVRSGPVDARYPWIDVPPHGEDLV